MPSVKTKSTNRPMSRARRFHRFAYPTHETQLQATPDKELEVRPAKGPKGPLPFKTRDGAAFAEIHAALNDIGWKYGSLIYNCRLDDDSSLQPGSCGLGPEDVIVLTTRPPLHDLHDKRSMRRSDTCLEKGIFAEFGGFLEECTRSYVSLAGTFASPVGKTRYYFHQNKDARLIRFNGPRGMGDIEVPKGEYRSIAFFLHKRRIAEYGCGLLACWGMGGIETLIWAHLLRTRFSDWLPRHTFNVVELDIGGVPDRSATLDFAANVKVSTLLEHPISD